jgi:hypothetical protein
MQYKLHLDIKKLREYCLNPNHPVGKHKARVFFAALGVTKKDSSDMKKLILKKMEEAEIQLEYEDEYGKRISSVLELDINEKKAFVKTIWIIKRKENTAYFVTCYIN